MMEKNLPKKSHNAEKNNWTGDALVSASIVCYAKKGKPFWLSSLGQMVQFDTIKFRKTFKNYIGQFVWIQKSH